ncbi:MAG TPA: ArsC/Spx/MgsR family protein [Flavobacteriaceae bacterium]|nr:ArsC/Spx/MgsR family protein [Flavobacteriaceae bacterium]
MKTFFYLKTCDTCRRFLKELQLPEDVILREIKEQPLTLEEMKRLQELSGNYEVLFSRNSRLYKERNLKEKQLTENDFLNLILNHYTFLKRPVLVLENQIFIGNSAKTIQAAKEALHA